MLDTCICSFTMRDRPTSILAQLEEEVAEGNKILISAIIYAEMPYGQIGKKTSPKLGAAIDEFVRRLDGILPWDAAAVDTTIRVRQQLAAGCVLVTNKTLEFSRVTGLQLEDCVH